MRRTTAAAMAMVLALSATPALGTEAEDAGAAGPTAAATATAGETVAQQRVEMPNVGLAIAFPADWEIRTLDARRESEIRSGPEDDPVYVVTTLYAKSPDGRWCDVDMYEAIPVSLEQHVFAYAGYLQSVYRIDRAVEVTEVELPLGEAYRIDMLDSVRDRVWAMYLFDQATADAGTPDRFLVTCVADPGSEPYWEAIAETIELTEPVEDAAPGA